MGPALGDGTGIDRSSSSLSSMSESPLTAGCFSFDSVSLIVAQHRAGLLTGEKSVF